MIYRFGDYEVDTKLLELRRAGVVHPIDPLGFDLLKYLIENRDRVLTRDELLDALWPGKVVTDSALSSRLKSVRAAVGDSGAAQQVIKTVHGRGYRFVADLDDAADTHTSTPAPPGDGGWIAKTSAVGRDAELGKLARWLDRAVEGERAIVFVCGEAGVGKTTLGRAFLNAAKERAGVYVMHGQCVNQRGASEPYLPLLEALGRAGQHDSSLVDLLREHAPAWLAQLPTLARDAAGAALKPALDVSAGRMLRELSETLESLAQRRTVILFLEDLHWSDPSTINWLEYYARRNDAARVLLLATFRPDGEIQAIARELAIRGYAHGVHLESIDEADVSDYLANRLDHPAAPALAALTYRRTGGFPLFIDTLVDHWLANGLIRKIDGTWSAADEDAALLAGVPETLSQLIDQQFANLQDVERRLLETAALAGSPFAAAAVAHALDESAEEIEALFGRLARQGRIVRNAGDVQWPDGTVTAIFEFRHDLFRDALYERVTASRRARLHCALGDRLERAYQGEPGPVAGQIADHFARAHEAERALKYFYPAALLSFNRSAYRETAAVVDRALSLIDTLPDSFEAQNTERDLLLLRGSAMIFLEGWASPRVEESYTRARAVGEKLGIEDNAPEVFAIAAMHENRGLYTKSQAVIESLLERSSELRLEAHELLACSLFHQGRFDQSKRNADRAIEEFDPQAVSAILARYGENPGVGCHSWAALDLCFMGYPDSALERSDKALELAAGHFYSRCSAMTLRTFLHQFRNEPEQTIAWSEKTREVAEKQGFHYRIAQIMILDGWARGQLAGSNRERREALESLDTGIASHAKMGSEMDLPHFLTLRAELLARMDRHDEALAVQMKAIESNPKGREFFYEAEMLRRHATLQRDSGPAATERAERLLEDALKIARRQGARLLELRVCRTRCELTDGRDAAKIRDLEDVMAAFDEGRDTPDFLAAVACAKRSRRSGKDRRERSRVGPT